MPSIQIRSNAGQISQSLTTLGPSIERITNAKIEAVLQEALTDLEKEGEPISYPVHWDSERQRKAFFATNGFGRGIPTRRTGRYISGFKLEKTGFGTDRRFTISNDVPYAKYVGGTALGQAQSNIHRGRWQIVSETVRKYAERLVRAAEVGVSDAIRNWGGGL